MLEMLKLKTGNWNNEVLILAVTVLGQGRLDCRTETLNTCIKLADPLLEDPKYVFPANNPDVDHVCK